MKKIFIFLFILTALLITSPVGAQGLADAFKNAEPTPACPVDSPCAGVDSSAQIVLDDFVSDGCGFGGFCNYPTKFELLVMISVSFFSLCMIAISLPYIFVGIIKKVTNKNDKTKQDEANKLIKIGIIIFVICFILTVISQLIKNYFIR